MSKHTPEPWTAELSQDNSICELQTEDAGQLIADFRDGVNPRRDLGRAAVCVNACAGISNPAGIRAVVEAAISVADNYEVRSSGSIYALRTALAALEVRG